MNNYVRKLFGVLFPSQTTPQIVRIQPSRLPTSPEEWRQHWQSQGQPWRTESEIDAKRQEELSRHRTIIPDIDQGIYPFKGVKLSRADVEWLLATHENGRGPVDWSDQSQRDRKGLDLRGADLVALDLQGLPLACMNGGLNWGEWSAATDEQRLLSAIHLERTNLSYAHLENTTLRGAYLERANLSHAHLEEATLYRAHLEGADFFNAHLEGASLWEASLGGKQIRAAKKEKRWQRYPAVSLLADLQFAIFDHTTHLDHMVFDDEQYSFALLADVRWNGANLTVIDWAAVKMLGDEYVAHQRTTPEGDVKDRTTQLSEYRTAVRASRQLAVALQDQGLSEDAARFAYRAQILQRKVFWMQREIGRWLFSLMLALLAGYGYRMWRILVAYLLVILLCAAAYFVLGMYSAPHLSLLDALLTSITAFHGRVFSEPFLQPGEPQLWVTAFEAVAGLVIEGVFIAMLTQKFFGK